MRQVSRLAGICEAQAPRAAYDRRTTANIRSVVHGFVVGVTASALGANTWLAVFGFWMGRAVVLAPAAALGLTYSIWRQRSGRVVCSWSLGVTLGLAPVAWWNARHLRDFAMEFGLPLVMGACCALALGPLYVRGSRAARHRTEHLAA